jgi:hypothetical protein
LYLSYYPKSVIPTGAQRSGELALSEVEWGSAVCLSQPNPHTRALALLNRPLKHYGIRKTNPVLTLNKLEAENEVVPLKFPLLMVETAPYPSSNARKSTCLDSV